MIEKRLLHVIKVGVLFAWITPLIYVSHFLFPFIWGKTLFAQLLIELLTVLWVALMVVAPEYRPKMTPLTWAYGAVVFSLFLSALFGVDFGRSLWSTHERATGVFFVMHMFVLFLITKSVYRTSQEARSILWVGFLSAVVVGMTGFIQHFSDYFLSQKGGGRVAGTFGNPIYLGQYMLMFIFWTPYLITEVVQKKWAKLVLGLSTAFFLLMLVYSGTRGAEWPFIIGIFIAIMWVLLRRPGKTRIIAFSSAVFLVALFGALFATRETLRPHVPPLLFKVIDINLQGGTASTRLIAWKIAGNAFLNRPVFGWGHENFYYAFNQFYNPESLRHSYYETWFDHAHNFFMDLFANTGIVGIAAYAFLIWTVLNALIARHKDGFGQPIGRKARLFAALVFLTYLGQSFFAFDHPASYVALALFLAWLDVLLWATPPEKAHSALSRISKIAITGSAAFVVMLLIFFVNVRQTRANTMINYGVAWAGVDPNRAMALFKQVIGLPTPHRGEIAQDIGKTVDRVIRNPQMTEEGRRQWLDFGRDVLRTVAIPTNPRDVNNYLLLGQIETSRISYDPAAANAADKAFEEGLRYSPKRQQVYYSWARVKMVTGETAKGIEILERARALDPSIADTYWFEGVLYTEGNQHKQGYAIMKEALARGFTFRSIYDVAYMARLADEFGTPQEKIKIYETFVQMEEGATKENYLKLADAYAAVGRRDEALRIRDAVEKGLRPNLTFSQ